MKYNQKASNRNNYLLWSFCVVWSEWPLKPGLQLAEGQANLAG